MDGAVAEGDHQFRIRCLFVDVLQSPFHINRDRPGHDQRIGMSRRGGDVNAEPLDVINSDQNAASLRLFADSSGETGLI
jgi:hypothetical protein